MTTMELIAVGWEHAAESHRADAEHHRAHGDLIAALVCDAEAAVYERNADQLRRTIDPTPGRITPLSSTD